MVLVSHAWTNKLTDVFSEPSIPIASHHFVVQANVELEIQKIHELPKTARWNVADLDNPCTARYFAQEFADHVGPVSRDMGLDEMEAQMQVGFQFAASQTLTTEVLQPRRP